MTTASAGVTSNIRRVAASVVLLGALAVATLGVRAFLSRNRAIFDPGTAEGFFERYVEVDGRVVRHDQGGDTVSEGQAYAMLLAVALRDEDRFRRVWQWTKDELQRADGLLSWKWSDGRVVDEQAAADADVDAAYALLRAADAFGDAGFRRDAVRMIDAIRTGETIGRNTSLVLAAGPWAVDKRVVNPSYFDPRAFRAFAKATGQARWDRAGDTAVELLRGLTSEGRRLPPDWARLDGRRLSVLSGADADAGPGRYGYDAPRALIRCAVASDARSLAARWWPAARAALGDDPHPVHLVAAAAGAHAAGDTGARDRLFERARSEAIEHPTYYGWAWAALGPAMLDGVLSS